MSWLGHIRELLSTACGRRGGPTIVESEEVLATIPMVFEVTAWCPRCGTTAWRRQVVDCVP
jgi:hypothetical protein